MLKRVSHKISKCRNCSHICSIILLSPIANYVIDHVQILKFLMVIAKEKIFVLICITIDESLHVEIDFVFREGLRCFKDSKMIEKVLREGDITFDLISNAGSVNILTVRMVCTFLV